MNKITPFLLVAAVTVSFVLGASTQTKAENKGFSGVVPFSSPTGFLGFFNQNDGKVYIYDNTLSTCVFEGQVEELGKGLKKIHQEQPPMMTTYTTNPPSK